MLLLVFFVSKSDHLLRNYDYPVFGKFWTNLRFSQKSHELQNIQKIFQIQLFI